MSTPIANPDPSQDVSQKENVDQSFIEDLKKVNPDPSNPKAESPSTPESTTQNADASKLPPPLIISPKVDSLFIRYVHQQTLQNQPIDLGKAVEIFNQQGVPFTKSKDSKDYLLRLFRQYSTIFDFLEQQTPEARTFDTVKAQSFDFSIDPYQTIIKELSLHMNQPKEETIEKKQESKPEENKEKTKPEETQKEKQEEKKEEPVKEKIEENIEEQVKEKIEEKKEEQGKEKEKIEEKIEEKKQEKTKEVNQKEEIQLESSSTLKDEPRLPPSPLFTEIDDINVVIPELNMILLSYGVDLILAQYRDAARDIRYMLLTYIDLYKDQRLLFRTIDFIKEAIQRLEQSVKQYEHERDLYSQEEIEQQVIGIREHPEAAYNWLTDYYYMLLSLFQQLSRKELQLDSSLAKRFNLIYQRLQHHLANLRTKSPPQVEEYKRTIQISHPLPTQRMLIVSDHMKSLREKQVKQKQLQIPSDLVYYCFLAIYDHNPLLIIEDPHLEKMIEQLPDISTDFLSLFLSLSPEQRLQFIAIVNDFQPFDRLFTSRKEQRPLLLLLQKFVQDNTNSTGCDSLQHELNDQLQAIQADLKRWITQWGENPRQQMEHYLLSKYQCASFVWTDEHHRQMDTILEQGLAGQVSLLHQLYQHYPSICSILTLQKLLHHLKIQHQALPQHFETNSQPTNLSPPTSLQFLHHQIEDRDLSHEQLTLKGRLLRIRDFFNSINNRKRIYQYIDLLKKRHLDLSNRELAPKIRASIIELLPEEEDPIRVFLLNFLHLYGSLDKIPITKPDAILDLKQLRHLSPTVQDEVIRRASFFLLGTSLHLESNAYFSLRDQAVLHHLEYLLYYPDPSSVVSFIEERIQGLTLHSSFPEFQQDIHRIKQRLIRQVKQHQFVSARQTVQTLLTLTHAKIMQDPLQSSKIFRTQRYQSRSLSEKVASRLPPLPTPQKEALLWYILKPWLDHMSHTEYRHFEYFIALPEHRQLSDIDLSALGCKINPTELGFLPSIQLFRPTLKWWSHFLEKYPHDLVSLIQDMTIEGGPKQLFVMGLFAPGYTAHILTARDFRREHSFFEKRKQSVDTQFHQWIQQPLQSMTPSLQSYLESLIHKIIKPHEEKVASNLPTAIHAKARDRMRSAVFIQTLLDPSIYNQKERLPTLGDALLAFFRVYTFLSPQSIVFGYARSILTSFERSPPGWYRYLLQFSLLELFPELTLVDPSIRNRITSLLNYMIQKQVHDLFLQFNSSSMTLSFSLDKEKERTLDYLLQHEVRPYVQTRWCPIDRETVQYLSANGDIQCYHLSQAEQQDPHIPTTILQAIKAQLEITDSSSTERTEDLTLDTDIEMTAIRYFTEIIRDQHLRSGEFTSSRLARDIAKAHPHPITGKQAPVDPIRERLQDIAQAHYLSLLKQLISQYISFHPELRYQMDRERTTRYKQYAIQQMDLTVAENDWEGRKQLLQHLFQTIKTAFELDIIDEHLIAQLVQFALLDQQTANSSRITQSTEEPDLPFLCGSCNQPTNKTRLSYFYKHGIAEPQFFCSLACSNKYMDNYQDEPDDQDVKLQGDHSLFLQLLKYYPNKGSFEEGEDGLYIPDLNRLLQFEEPLRAFATSINDELASEPDLITVYRGVMSRYRDTYLSIIHSHDSKQKSVFVIDGCDITLRQIKDFIRKHTSLYYDQLVDGTFHFVNHESSVMTDFFQAFPECADIPSDIRKRYLQYKRIKRLAFDIDRAIRLTILSDLSETEQIQQLQTRLEQIYQARYLHDIQKTYPYLSDADHMAKVKRRLRDWNPSKDVELALQFLNQYATIDQRLHSTQELLQEILRLPQQNSGKQRLLRLLEQRGQLGLKIDLDQFTKTLALMREIADIFLTELRAQIYAQKIVVRRTLSIPHEPQQIEKSLPSTYIGISRKHKRQHVIIQDPVLKKEFATSKTELEEQILDEQLLTLGQLIDQELRLYL